MRAIYITHTGGPDVLTHTDIDAPTPKDNEVVVQVDIAGVNFIDVYFREGIYHSPTPFVPGFEGTGRVIYDPQGEIAEGTVVAASMLLQGITAHYLPHGVYDLSEGDSCLITAGAGGVGLLATQMAASAGATVYSVVSSEEKVALAYEAGATEVFFYSDNLAEDVRRRNGGVGVDVVYDGVGKATFNESLEAVRPRGTVCLFGAASGPVDPIDPQVLNTHGSIFLTRPSIGAWTAREGEFAMRAQAVTRAVTSGELNVRVGAVYPLADAAAAHRDLEARVTTGSVVLQVS